MRTRIFLKLIAGLSVLLALALLTIGFMTSKLVESTYMSNRWRELEDKAKILQLAGATSLAGSGQASQTKIREVAKAAGARITVVDRTGKVIADSEMNPATMDNHRDRPEVAEALAGQRGSSLRNSVSLHEEFLYLAVPIPEGALRLAVPLAVVRRDVGMIRTRTLQSTALAFVPVILLALFFAQRTSFRLGTIIAYAGELANGNFHARLPDYRSGELAVLGRKLNETSAKLEGTVQQLQSEHTELEKLERVRKDFVINVSHELRTPLASIQGYAETLMDGALYDEAHAMRFLTIIRHNAERLARLTSDLLALSRIEMKRQEFRFAVFRVHELLADVLDTIRPIVDKKQITLVQEIAPSATEVYCDSEALYQILSNLVDNAVKYTPERGTITVAANLCPPVNGRRMLEFYVKDTGVGIPPEDQSRLFERFYRVDKARSRELGGTGLGLAIVKHLVLTHGGEVRVESELHRGSTFYFTLPAEPMEQNPSPELHPEFTAS